MAKKEIKPVVDFPFGKENFRLMLISIGIIILAMICMSGGGDKDPAVWDPSIFNFQRITLSPILFVLGLLIGVYAILKKSKT